MENFSNRSIYFAKLSVLINLVMSVGKLGLGIIYFSYFLFISAFYNLGIAFAKFYAVQGHVKSGIESQMTDPEEVRKKQHTCYHNIGFIVFISSIIFVVYNLRMFITEKSSTNYSSGVAIAIAAVTFTEIVLAVNGSITARKSQEPIIEAIKLTNLAAALISLVLTQTAILSFKHKGSIALYNGFSGIFMGSLAALIGLYMMLRNLQKGNGLTRLKEKIMKKSRTI